MTEKFVRCGPDVERQGPDFNTPQMVVDSMKQYMRGSLDALAVGAEMDREFRGSKLDIEQMEF